MKRSTLALFISCAMFSTASFATPVQLASVKNLSTDTEVNGFQSSLFYSDTGTVNGFDLPILGYTEMDQVNGFQLGAAAGSHVRNGVNGAAIGLFNWHGGEDNGLNISLANQVGVMNGASVGIYSAADELNGLNIGAANAVGNLNGTGDINGMNVAALGNYNKGRMYGLNVAGLGNYTEGTMRGMNVAGIGNYIGGDMKGFNVSPFSWVEKNITGANVTLANHSRNVEGLNVGGIANWSEGDIKGMNVAVVNVSENMTGLNVAPFNKSKETVGANISAFNWSENTTGFNMAAFNRTNDMTGFNLGAFNVANNVTGMNLGAVNFNGGNVEGLNMGAVNVTSENVTGSNIGAINVTSGSSSSDFGAFNYADTTNFQFGLINATKHLEGLQIGVINVAMNATVPVLPLVNFHRSF